jgi:hypothetical protein
LRFREIKTLIAGLGYYIAKKKRDKEREAQNKLNLKSNHYGEVKKRYKGIDVVCMSNTFRSSDYGGYFITKLKTDNDILIYFGTSLEDLNEGDKAIIDFTVKNHNEFNGVLNTQINRPKKH